MVPSSICGLGNESPRGDGNKLRILVHGIDQSLGNESPRGDRSSEIRLFDDNRCIMKDRIPFAGMRSFAVFQYSSRPAVLLIFRQNDFSDLALIFSHPHCADCLLDYL